MQRISARGAAFDKVLSVLIWYGMLGYAAIRYLSGEFGGYGRIMLASICVVGLLTARPMKRIWQFADVVYDLGDALLIRRAGQEDTIPLSNIRKVTWHGSSSLRFITLQLDIPSRFGAQIRFSAQTPLSLNWHAEPPLVADLTQRVTAARLAGR